MTNSWEDILEEQRDRRLHFIISQFQHGEEKFAIDPLVKTCVLQILEGQNPINLIDQLITNINTLQKQVTELVLRGGPAPIYITMTKDEAQSFKEIWLKEGKETN